MSRIDLFGTPVDALSLDETKAAIGEVVERGGFAQHVVVNVAKVVSMRRDRGLREAVEACDIVNIDGMGLVWGGRMLGHRIPERVAGIDLFEALVALAAKRGWPVFLLGAEADIVARAAAALSRSNPGLKIAGCRHGYFAPHEEEQVAAQVAASGARLLFVAMPSPKKEKFINRWRGSLGVNFVMGVGGSFDVVAGKVKRAPLWMQKAGLEWAYRVYQEPRRMWKRYALTNSVFAAMMAKALTLRAVALVAGGQRRSP